MNDTGIRGYPPRRVVSVAPSITDSLIALGLGGHLAGATDLCVLPEGMENVKRVGRPESIRTAEVLSLHPDRILAAGEENSVDQIGEWTRSELPLWVYFPENGPPGGGGPAGFGIDVPFGIRRCKASSGWTVPWIGWPAPFRKIDCASFARASAVAPRRIRNPGKRPAADPTPGICFPCAGRNPSLGRMLPGCTQP